MIYIIIVCVGFCCFIMGYIYRWHGVPFVGKWKTPFIGLEGEISIGISRCTAIAEIQQNSSLVLSKDDVNDVNAYFVADPFIFQKKNKWYMFMEVFNKSRNLGEIGMATSEDGVRWAYRSIVLREQFHLSYPYVFEHKQEIWMIPETGMDNSVRLYRAKDFPQKWTLEKKLITGRSYTDPSIFQHKGVWWMFVSHNKSRDLFLYFADDLMGPWQMHPDSPIVYFQPEKARCAGRVVKIDGKLIRFAQDCEHDYGKSVSAFHIECLDKKHYNEIQWGNAPVLFHSGQGWNAKGMHHIDLHVMPDGSFLSAVDGWTRKRAFGLKY